MAVAVEKSTRSFGAARPEGASDRLYNEDLAPTNERLWGTYSLFAMWMSDVHSIGGYTFAAGGFFLGLGGGGGGGAGCVGGGFFFRVFVVFRPARPRGGGA